MRDLLGGDLLRAASRFAIIGMLGGLTAACSTERFASTTFTNPFSSGSAEPSRTGSLAPAEPAAPMPRSSIETQPLSPIRPVTSAPVHQPTPHVAAQAPHAAQALRPRTASGGPGWSTTGGTTVIVGPGETLSTLTSRYGVPADAILSSNGLSASDVTAGRRVVIPVYSATGESAAGSARRVEAPRHATPDPAARVVASQKIEVKKQPPKTVAEAAPTKTQLRPGQAVAKASEPARPAPRVAETKAQPAPAKVAAKPEPKKAEAKVAKAEPKPAKVEPKLAKAEPKAEVKVARAAAAQKEVILPAKKIAKAEPAKVEAPQKVAAAPKTSEPARAPVREPEVTASIAPAAPVAPATPAQSSSGSSDFRWPARGRVISGFGNGGGNEGINIAVPEGTPVKAAGDGVVAYAGSEVKGYGNLVLIRHDNGYVSAYANNGQIDVKRGQRVTRGHTIAKSGQTGNVTSPQLHFEIRKGSTPVDPMKYLASAE